jgi:hypothetical protein
VNSLQAGKHLECALVICKMWRSAMMLQLIVIMSCVLKWSINPISDPKPRRESLKIVTVQNETVTYQWALSTNINQQTV